MPANTLARVASPGKWMLLWLPVAATVYGYFAYAIVDRSQLPHLALLLVIALLVNALAWASRQLYRSLPLALVVGATWIVAALFHAGLAASAAVALLVLGAIGLGSLGSRGKPDGLLSLLVGLALMAALAGWLLPFPVHTRLAYTLVLAAIVVASGPRIRQILASETAALASALREAPRAAFVAINVVGICSTPLWLPTLQADDISYHLSLPYQLQDLAYYRMDPIESIWALAPWSADVVQAIPQVLADGEARGATNLMWMLALYAGMWRLARTMGLPPVLAWAAIALHGSLPIASALLASMQTELPSSALIIGLVLAIATMQPADKGRLRQVAVLAGMMIAIKLSSALMLVPIALWMMVRVRAALPWQALPSSVLLGAFVALPSYAYGLLITGNPFLPFLNGVFKWPHFMAENWKDPTWFHPIDATLPWELMFDTSSFLTAANGAAGFVYLFCVPGLILALLHPRFRAVAMLGLAGFALVFAQIHFIRYTHPSTALLILGALGGFHFLGVQRALVAAIALLCTLNLGAINLGYWQLRDGALGMLLKSGKETTTRVFAPQRVVAAKIRAHDDGTSSVIFHKVDSDGNAELTLPARTTSWYNWTLLHATIAADKDRSGRRWRTLLEESGATLLVTDRDKVSAALKAALEAVGTPAPELSEANYEAWRIASRQPTLLQLVPGHATADYSTFDYDQPSPGSTVNTSAKFRCDIPGEPIVISIAARRATAQENLISGWAMCKDDGIAEGRVEAVVPADTKGLVFIAWPRTRMSYALLDSQSGAMPDASRSKIDPATEIRRRLRLE